MNTRLIRRAGALMAAGLLTCGAQIASAKPILMPTLQKEAKQQRAYWQQHTLAPLGPIQPPAPPCPENGLLPSPFSNCGLPEAPATTLPYLGNMAYYGGHVVTDPKIYIVYWGWGEPGAFPSSQTCSSETITGSTIADKAVIASARERAALDRFRHKRQAAASSTRCR